MQKQLLFLFALVVAVNSTAAAWRPSEQLLDAVCYIESGGGLFTWGDNGHSLGPYQMSRAAWLDVSRWRKGQGLPTFAYNDHVWIMKSSRTYAADYLAILHRALEQKQRLNRSPSAAEVYAAYNLGLSSFAKCRYQLASVNRRTAWKCEQIQTLVDNN